MNPYTHRAALLLTVTPLHSGDGTPGLLVDQQITRQRSTGWPIQYGSGIRGAARRRALVRDSDLALTAFGPEHDDASRYAGCLSLPDAHVVAFPVCSDVAPCLWVTCPSVLADCARRARLLCGASHPLNVALPATDLAPDQCVALREPGAKLVLDDGLFTRVEGKWPAVVTALGTYATLFAATLPMPDLETGLVLVSDMAFTHLTHVATEVRTRVALNERKVTIDGALFSVEAIPEWTVLTWLPGATAPRRPPTARDGEAPPETPPPAAETEIASPSAPMDGPHMLAKLEAWLRTGDGPGDPSVLTLGGEEGIGFGVTQLAWIDPPKRAEPPPPASESGATAQPAVLP